MLRWKNILYNITFALNCLLIFLLLFESRMHVPAWAQTIGRMHTLLLHFPIVLLLLSIICELVSLAKKYVLLKQSQVADFLLLITAFTSALSALMGLLLSKEDGYTQDIVVWHKWGGILIAVVSLAWYTYRSKIRQQKIVFYSTAATAFVALLITGHLGGDITHGDDFLLAPVSKEKQQPSVLFEDAIVYANMVQPILQSKCMSCHNEKKAKGELVMLDFKSLLKGSKSGPLWDFSKPDLGLLLGRIHLPEEDKKHMPPAGKPQLTPTEEDILYHWIKAGADDTLKVAALAERDTLRMIAASTFKNIETDDYHFAPADEKLIKTLKNNYRQVAPLAMGSPALDVTFFSATQFHTEQLKELLQVKEQVVSLDLNKMPVTDNDLVIIAQLKNLRKLNLSFTNINGSGLAALNSLQQLKQLSLSGTAVTVAALSKLSSLVKLTELYIWSTPAQTENLSTLQKGLKKVQIQTGFKGDTITIKLNKPLIENEDPIVIEPVQLQLKHPIKGTTIHFTTDGKDPDSLSPVFKEGFLVDRNMMIKAKAYKPGWITSDILEKIFYKAGYYIDSIRLLQPAPDETYKSIPAAILIDRKKGEPDFRTGSWIGYRGVPMQTMLYLQQPTITSQVTISSRVDIGSKIMPPSQVEVWGGNDANHLRLLTKTIPEQPKMEAPSYLKAYELKFDKGVYKCLKVVLTPLPKLPIWHSAKGEKAWVFVDEILLN